MTAAAAVAGATVTPAARQHGTRAGAAGAEPPAHPDRVVHPPALPALRTRYRTSRLTAALAVTGVMVDARRAGIVRRAGGGAPCARVRRSWRRAPCALSHPARAVAPRSRRCTPCAPLHPVRAVAPRARCRTPSAPSHPVRRAPSGRTSSVLSRVICDRRRYCTGCDGLAGCVAAWKACGVEPPALPYADHGADRRSRRRTSHVTAAPAVTSSTVAPGVRQRAMAREGEPLRPAHADHALTRLPDRHSH